MRPEHSSGAHTFGLNNCTDQAALCFGGLWGRVVLCKLLGWLLSSLDAGVWGRAFEIVARSGWSRF